MGSNNWVSSRWFTEHHGLLRRLYLDRIKVLDEAVADLDGRIVAGTARWQCEADLLTSAPGIPAHLPDTSASPPCPGHHTCQASLPRARRETQLSCQWLLRESRSYLSQGT